MSPIVHVTGRTGLSQIRVWLGFLPPSDRCAAVLRVELQRGAIVGHAEAIRTQSRKPSKALLPYHIGSRVAYVHTCYKETGWQGTHRQSETRAGNHRMHTRIRNAGPPALREPQTATPQPHSYASRFATQGSNHTLNL